MVPWHGACRLYERDAGQEAASGASSRYLARAGAPACWSGATAGAWSDFASSWARRERSASGASVDGGGEEFAVCPMKSNRVPI
jgi:hypothetical protein